MPSMPWVKLWIEMLDDVKLAELDDAQKWRFVQLVLLAGECDAAGALVTGESRMTHAQIAWRLRCDKNVIDKDIEKLVEIGLVSDNGVVQVVKFGERQGPTQAEKRQKWAERQQKRREKSNVTRDSRVTHADVTPLEEEGEEDINASGAKTAPKAPKIPPREDLAYYRLQERFLALTGLPMPKPKSNGDWKEFNTLWIGPGKDILSWVDYDAQKAGILVEESVRKMKKDNLTVANFKSIIKVASAEFGDRNNGHQ